MFLLKLGRVILQLEKARRELLAVDPSDKEKLLGASQKVDELIVEYYRVKLYGDKGVRCSASSGW